MMTEPDLGQAGGGTEDGRAGAAVDTGGMVYRIVWLPGSDLLRGYCWCGCPKEAEDPVELWEWLLDHPDQHDGGRTGPPSAPPPRQRPGGPPDRQLAGTST